MADKTRIGFIGLGTMGAGMARNFQKAGYPLVVHDIRRAAADQFLSAGAVWADTPAAVARAAAVVLTSLPAPPDVEAVALGKDGILAGAQPGSVYCDLSTNSLSMVKRIYAAFAEKRAHMLDTPVSGGPAGAASGKMAIWVGGDEAVFKQVKPALDSIGDAVRYIGPIGSGTIAKLVHNCAGYAVNTAIAEVMTLGVKAGLEPLELWRAVRQGAVGRRRTFDTVAANFLVDKYEPPNFMLKLAHKDVGLATALGRELGVPMRIANMTLEEMTEAMGRGWGEKDSRIAMTLETERAGIKIKCDPDAVKKVLDSE
ncbi:MAG TPA: NAD(P)-dependent oxidoreductase [Stellaceae bacterium]|nr:NAD(P)-dependent oxidoreductase [Stellaceae bacterium]